MENSKISTGSTVWTVLLVVLLAMAMLLTACSGGEPPAADSGTQTFSATDGDNSGTVDGPARVKADLGEDYVVEWVDAAFEKLIRQELNKPSGDIYRSDLDVIEQLIIAGPDYIASDISLGNESQTIGGDGPQKGLGMYSDEWYEIDGERHTERGEITRLDDLVHLKNLFSVRIHFNKINDLSALKDCPWLEDVNLGKSEISDITPLSSLTKMRWLELRDNKISDLTPISGLTELEYVDFSGNQISDITALKDLKNLDMVSLSRNQIVDLAPVSGLTKLIYLWAEHNQISDLSALKDLSALETIDLGQNKISDLRPLAGLEKLRQIGLTDNPVTDWSPVAHVEDVIGRP